uniref:Uncharacterized protein n=1 Tax=Dulem virus 42 TaxID=3145760 RepID=A0AAU8B8N7_9CAUD
MARKKNSLSAFDDALNEFGFNNTMSQPETTDINRAEEADIDEIIENQTTSINTTEVNNETGDSLEDDSEIPEDVLNNNIDSNQTSKDE